MHSQEYVSMPCGRAYTRLPTDDLRHTISGRVSSLVSTKAPSPDGLSTLEAAARKLGNKSRVHETLLVRGTAIVLRASRIPPSLSFLFHNFLYEEYENDLLDIPNYLRGSSRRSLPSHLYDRRTPWVLLKRGN